MSDKAWEQRHDDFSEHMRQLVPKLSDGAEELAVLNLHDAQPIAWSRDEPGHFWMKLLIGDVQVGYRWAEISYDDAALVGVSLSELEQWPLTEREVGAEEFDLGIDGRIEHRLLLWPDGEFGIVFGRVSIHLAPAVPSDRRSL
ncbi:MAG: hypothetical protein GY701_02645 [Sulfitobacter sp.]|nr:hypothetical protein [Sulfitobacter sp.]